MSDHSLITCSLLVHRPSPPSFARRVRSWRGVDRDALRQHIVESSLGRSPPSTVTAGELFEMYDNTLRSIADQLAPECTVKCQLRPICPWFDAECRTIRRNCRRLERRYRKTFDPADEAAYVATSREKHGTFEQKKKS